MHINVLWCYANIHGFNSCICFFLLGGEDEISVLRFEKKHEIKRRRAACMRARVRDEEHVIDDRITEFYPFTLNC